MARTMSEALRESLEDLGGIRTKDAIAKWVQRRYKARWAHGTLRDHLYGGRVNNPLAYRHHPGQKKFLYDHGDHRYELFDERKHGRFQNGVRVGPEESPGWILIHSQKHNDYGPDAEYPSPMAELEDEDAEHRNDVHWNWKFGSTLSETSQLRRILLAWKGNVFGEALASITHKNLLPSSNFALILHKYSPVEPALPLTALPLSGRESNNRGLIKLNNRILTAFDSARGWLPSQDELQQKAEAEELVDLFSNPNRFQKSGSRGFLKSVEARKCVEDHAMEVAKAYLIKMRFRHIVNTSKNRSYDYVATKCGRRYIAEVKGTTTAGAQFIITSKEIRQHRQHHPNNILIVVHSVHLDRSGKKPRAFGGTPVMTPEWVVDDERLTALSYTYRT